MESMFIILLIIALIKYEMKQKLEEEFVQFFYSYQQPFPQDLNQKQIFLMDAIMFQLAIMYTSYKKNGLCDINI